MESVERRERPDNLELLDLLEDEDDLETTGPKETLYDTHNEMSANKHNHNHIRMQINDLRRLLFSIFRVLLASLVILVPLVRLDPE